METGSTFLGTEEMKLLFRLSVPAITVQLVKKSTQSPSDPNDRQHRFPRQYLGREGNPSMLE